MHDYSQNIYFFDYQKMTPRKPNQNMNRQFEIICLNKGGNAGVLWLIWTGGSDDSQAATMYAKQLSLFTHRVFH